MMTWNQFIKVLHCNLFHIFASPSVIVPECQSDMIFQGDHFSSVLVRGGTITALREAFGVKITDPEPS